MKPLLLDVVQEERFFEDILVDDKKNILINDYIILHFKHYCADYPKGLVMETDSYRMNQ